MNQKCSIKHCKRDSGDVLWHGNEICSYHMDIHINSPSWPEYLFRKLRIKDHIQLTLGG